MRVDTFDRVRPSRPHGRASTRAVARLPHERCPLPDCRGANHRISTFEHRRTRPDVRRFDRACGKANRFRVRTRWTLASIGSGMTQVGVEFVRARDRVPPHATQRDCMVKSRATHPDLETRERVSSSHALATGRHRTSRGPSRRRAPTHSKLELQPAPRSRTQLCAHPDPCQLQRSRGDMDSPSGERTVERAHAWLNAAMCAVSKARASAPASTRSLAARSSGSDAPRGDERKAARPHRVDHTASPSSTTLAGDRAKQAQIAERDETSMAVMNSEAERTP